MSSSDELEEGRDRCRTERPVVVIRHARRLQFGADQRRRDHRPRVVQEKALAQVRPKHVETNRTGQDCPDVEEEEEVSRARWIMSPASTAASRTEAQPTGRANDRPADREVSVESAGARVGSERIDEHGRLAGRR